MKLQNYGIRGNCFELIKNYLCSRKQITKYNNVKSDTECILVGVPQGSVLGLLLSLLYINDIVNSASHSEFADDTNIFVSAENKEKAYNMANKLLRYVLT